MERQKIRARALAIVACALSACTQNPSREQAIHARLHPFIGRPITAYMQGTGMMPTGTFENGDGRVFVFEESRMAYAPTLYAPGTGFYVPAMSVMRECRIVVETSGAQNTITSLTAGEGC